MGVESKQELREIVPEPGAPAWAKERPEVDPDVAAFIAASPFAVLATSGADGRCDASPRGGDPGFARLLSPTRLVIPDYAGNRRQDSHRNILENPHVGLVFMVPQVKETLRLNGRARLEDDPELLATLPTGGRPPKLAIDVEVETVLVHCGKAPHRAGLWEPERWPEPVSLLRTRAAAGDLPPKDVETMWQGGFRDPAQLWG